MFLTWTHAQGRQPAAITQEQRLALLRRYVTSDQAELGPRVVACLMLLHAQPLSRILRLTISDITHHGGQVCLLLGDPSAPVPEPFAAMLTEPAAAQAAGGWLFPGQPLHYVTMRRHLQDLGLPLRTARTAALRELVLQVPAPVAATVLGFHHITTPPPSASAPPLAAPGTGTPHAPEHQPKQSPCCPCQSSSNAGAGHTLTVGMTFVTGWWFTGEPQGIG